MRSRTIAIVLGVGAAFALLGRILVRTPAEAPPPLPSAEPPPGGPRASVKVLDDGNPVKDLWVVFQDAAGTVTSAAKTGVDGKASGAMAARGMITVAQGVSVQSLVTIGSVDPNDELVLGEEEDEGEADEAVCTALVSLPGPHPKAARYAVVLGVGAAEADPKKPLPLSVVSRFAKDGKFQVLAEAFDANGEAVAFAHGVFEGCIRDGGRPKVEVKLPAWSTDYRPFVVTASGRPEAATTISGQLSIELGGPGDRFERGRREAPAADAATLHFAAPRPVGAHAKLKVALAYAGSPDRQVIEDERSAMPESIAIDLTEALLPRVSGAVVDDASSARPSVRWKVAGTAAKADAVVIRLSWPQTKEHVWTIVLPPDTPPRFALPALPEELAAWRPDGRPISASVALVDASFIEGFDAIKRKGLDALEDPPDAEQTRLRYSVTGDLDF